MSFRRIRYLPALACIELSGRDMYHFFHLTALRVSSRCRNPLVNTTASHHVPIFDEYCRLVYSVRSFCIPSFVPANPGDRLRQ